MTTPDGHEFGDEMPEADVVEQLIPIVVSDEDTWRDTVRITTARDWDADEADLIEQATPVPEDESDFDR